MKRIALVLLYVSCVAVLAPVVWGAPNSISKVKEFALPSISGQPYRPRISGDWVVSVRNYEKRAVSVVLINVVDKKAYTIFDIADGRSIFPSIDQNVIVWTGKSDQVESLRGTRGSRGKLPSSMIMLDLTTGSYYAPELKTVSASRVSVCGNLIAYELGSRIYLYDMSTGAQQRISDDKPYYSLPQINGDLVIWNGKSDDSDKYQIYLYQISKRRQTQITSDPVDHRGPATDGRYIVWWTDAGVEVYDTHNLSTFTIPKAFFPDVDKGIVVYQRKDGKISPVFGMDAATHQEFRISSGTANIGPDIDAGRVIWCANDTIYCAELSAVGNAAHSHTSRQ